MKKIFTYVLLIAAPLFSAAQATQMAKMPGGVRDGAICFAVGGMVYAGGGAGKDFYEFNPGSNQWTKKADIPGVLSGRAFASGVAYGDKGYVGLGGDENNTVLKNDWWEYTPTTNTWRQLADFPGSGRDGSAIFAAKGKIVVVGGTANQLVLEDAYEYDIATDTWKQIQNYPAGPIIFGSGFGIGDYGYVTCGAGAAEYTSTYRYDPTLSEWAQMADFPGTARQTALSFSVNGVGIVGGGQQKYQTAFKDFFSYSPATNSWTSEGEIGGKGRAWGIGVGVNGKAYMGTGWDFGSTFFDDWWEFTPQATTITEAEATPFTIATDPVNKQVVITASNTVENTARVLDINGREMIAPATFEGQLAINTSTLSAGIYILEIAAENGIYREKFRAL